MGKKKILIDTDIIIKIYRGNSEKKKEVNPIRTQLAISEITAIELLLGCNSRKKQFDIKKNLKAYQLFPLTEEIGDTALKLVFKYSVNHSIHVPDLLIASTAIQAGIPLFTDNKHHFDFIEELVLYDANR
jgi:tRNA(fMet)-specific endonuclease VapC